MSEELKLCPFCGKPIKAAKNLGGEWYWLHNNPNCPLHREIPFEGYMYTSRAGLVKEFNTRPIEDKLNDRLAAIRALAVDRDGFTTAESLGALVDEIAELAKEGDE